MTRTTSVSIALSVLLVLLGIALYLGMRDGDAEGQRTPQADGVSAEQVADREATTTPITVVAEDLEIPWDIAFLPDGSMLVTQRPGTLVHIEEGRSFEVEGVAHIGEGGLLGIALHPEFTENRFVYLYHTTREGGGLTNRIVRYVYEAGALAQDRIIIEGIPGAAYHDGGRIRFGPEGYLWATVGDAGDEDTAQDPQTLAGSILRLNSDGSIPEDNPFDNGVWSFGHRNPQGLAWDAERRLWSTEHGRSGLRSGMDEVNLIERGANYGWPEIEGDEMREAMRAPAAHSGPDVTWAPASAVYWDESLFFGGLRGEAIYEAVLDGEEVVAMRRHFHEEFGRIRSLVLGPDGLLYVTTSNRDGRGDPAPADDRIIRINPRVFRNEQG